MNPPQFKLNPLAAALAGILTAGMLSQPAQAAVRVWDGNGANDNWGYVQNIPFFPDYLNTNWTNKSIPGISDSLVFDSSSRLTPYNDLSNLSINGIVFKDGAGKFVLGGNAITSTDQITNNSGNLQTINMPIIVGNNQTWNGGTPGMTINGAVSLGNHNLTLQNKTAINNSGADFTVGDSGTASLALQSGSSLSNVNGYLGYSPGRNGAATVTGANSLWTNSAALYVGTYGNGTLNIQNGGTVSNHNGYLGNNAGSTGTATVTGTSSLWTNSYDLLVGNFGNGTLNIQAGGQVRNIDGFLGVNSGSTGTVTVTDADSLWANSGDLFVGHLGSGTLNIQSGGQVSNTNGYLSGFSGGAGIATVKGANSLWANSGDLFVGFSGSGTLNIQSGGKVSNTYGVLGLNSGSTGAATVESANSLWANRGDLIVGASGSGTLNIQNGGKVSNILGYLGQNIESTGTATVTGANSLWANSGFLAVGFHGNGSLNIQNGGQVSNGAGYLGGSGASTGAATVTGANSLWANSGDLAVGSLGRGTLNIGNGGAVTVGKLLNINGQGTLNLNGGSLSAAAALNTGGRFNWVAGTLNLGSVDIGAANSLLGDTLILDANHSLNVGGNATVESGAFVSLTGSDFNVGGNLGNDGILNVGKERVTYVDAVLTNTGSIINRGTLKSGIFNNSGAIQLAGSGKIVATTLNLNGGGINGTALDMSNIGTLTGNGTVASAVTGGTAANTIQTSGGNLDLGNTNSNNGFDFGGNLIVGSNQVNLLDKDKANLGVSTSLADGGRLNAANGADLSIGETLNYTGNASILGNFTNNGEVSGTGGALTFLNDVNGAGGFNGDIVFHGGYKPGNSPAAINFHGGDISFNATSVLTMEIFGNTPGSEYDQLLNIDHLDFNGTLALVFGNNFMPTAGSSFNLFDFSSFSGSFAPYHITVSGIDRALLDFSTLASNGKLQVAAVPLPAGVWLFLSGLMATMAFGKRRKV